MSSSRSKEEGSHPSPIPQPRPTALGKRFIPTRPSQMIKPKLGRNALTCLAYVFIAFVVIVAFMGVVVAKTGLVHVPLASMLYTGPQPTRVVEADITNPDAFADQITANVSAAVLRGESAPYAIPFSEADLTAAVRGGLAETIRSDDVVAEDAQVVVTPTYVEASGIFRKDAITFDVLVRFLPVVSDGALRLDVEKAYLGDIPIPSSLVTSMGSALFTRNVGRWNVNVGDISLQDINLKDGELELILDKTGS